MARVTINRLGRIGRATLKIALKSSELDVVAANELATPDDVAYLLKHDTVYGRYETPVTAGDGVLTVGANHVKLLHERDPALLPWRSLDIDIVFECTGAFVRREDLVKHVQAGASVCGKRS